MDKLRIYLAGPMFECSQDDMHAWREKLMSDYGHIVDFIDPTTHIMQNEDDATAIVERDKKAIDSADAVLAHTWKISPGTSMEIMYAYTQSVPVYVVSDKEESGWVHYHSEGVYDNFMDAMGDIFDSCARGTVRALTEREMNEGFTPMTEPDMVNHPDHYTSGGIETKDFIRAKNLTYNLGNAVKYITRSGKKAGACPVEDLKKAVFYLNDEIEAMENNAREQVVLEQKILRQGL